MMCRVIIGVYAALYGLALFVLIVGTFGLLSSERDPLAGVFLIPLGLPWTLITGRLPDAMRPIATALTPLVNLAVLIALCRLVRRSVPTVMIIAMGGAVEHI